MRKLAQAEGLYIDDETGDVINTHSMVKTFRRCPKQTEYKYVRRLKPKALSRPLKRGTWMHSLFETHYQGGDWRETHALLTTQFNALFDEEKEDLGDLPIECKRLMLSYLWHYGLSDPWKVHEVELTLETPFPDGSMYRGRIDMLVENQWGLWIVDHKTHKTLPKFDQRVLDAQSALYIWAAVRNKIPVQGFIWNYARTKAPTVPKLLKNGKALSRAKSIETDYPTLYKAIKKFNLPMEDYTDKLGALKAQRFQDGAPQNSPFFQRHILHKNDEMLKQVAREGYHTARRMNEYPWDKLGFIERVPDRSCDFMCSYKDLCMASLQFGEKSPGVQNMLRQRFTVGDPMEYYYDDKVEKEIA